MCEALDAFYKKNGRFPIRQECQTNSHLPCEIFIRRLTNMNYYEFIEAHYGINLKELRRNEFIQKFRACYERISPLNAADYMKRKEQHEPDIRTVYHAVGVEGWNVLLEALALEKSQPPELKVEACGKIIDQIREYERLSKLCDEMDIRFIKEGRPFAYLKKRMYLLEQTSSND